MVTESGFSRRQILKYAAASLAAIEAGYIPGAHAETAFTIAVEGASWSAGIKKSFSDTPKLGEEAKTSPTFLEIPITASVSRMLAQPTNPPASVVDAQSQYFIQMADAGILQGYDLDIVKYYNDIYETARLPARAGLKAWHAAMTLPIISMSYNTKLASKPLKYEDMWSSKYKGKIGIPDFGWYGVQLLHAINKQLGGTETNIDKGVQALSDLVKKNGAIVYKTQEQVTQAWANEEIVMMPWWNGRASVAKRKGIPVEMSYVPGTIQLHNGFVIAKQTAFKDAANMFVRNTLDPALQIEMVRLFNYPPSNKKAVLPSDVADCAVPSGALDNVVPLDWEAITATRVQALDRWNKEIIG